MKNPATCCQTCDEIKDALGSHFPGYTIVERIKLLIAGESLFKELSHYVTIRDRRHRYLIHKAPDFVRCETPRGKRAAGRGLRRLCRWRGHGRVPHVERPLRS